MTHQDTQHPRKLPCCATSECDPRNVVRVARAGNPLMTREQANRAHWPAWDGDEIDRTGGRVHLFLRRGIGANDADDLAERLSLRDREGDDQRIRIECSQLSDKGRCLAAATGRLAGADARLEPVQAILHGCDAFELCKGLA